MARSRALLVLLLVPVVWAGWLAAGLTRAQPAPATDGVPERYRDRLRAVDSLAGVWKLDTALTVLQPALREARRRGDRRALAHLVQVQGTLQLQDGRDPERSAREAVQLAAAAGDTATMMAALDLLDAQVIAHDGLEEPATEWLLRIALGRSDARYEGAARAAMAAENLDAGNFEDARRGFQRAIERSQQGADRPGEVNALIGFGRACFGLGDFDRARASHSKAGRLAAERSNELLEGQAFSHLGDLELALGDPEAAARHYRRSWEVLALTRGVHRWFLPAARTAIAEQDMGDLEAAGATLRQVISACDSAGSRPFQARAINQLANLQAADGRPADQAAAARQGLSLGRSLAPDARAELAASLAEALAAQDSSAAGMQVLDRETRGVRGRISGLAAARFDARRGELLLGLGRWREALDAFGRASRSSGRMEGWERVRLATLMARAERALGRTERAAARLDQALETWELDGIPPFDPEERERRVESSRWLFSLLAELGLPADSIAADSIAVERARSVFDVLQRFKTRRLLEGTLGPTLGLRDVPERLAASPIAAATLQDSVLAEDEVLLDLFVGPEASALFALTRTELRFARLPGEDELAAQLRAFEAAVTAPPGAGGAAGADSACAALGQTLLGEVADLVRSRRLIVYSPDGALAGVPLGALTLPGTTPAQALAADHEIARIPGASLLATLRAGRRPDPKRSRVLAFAGLEPGRDDPPPAALREARALGARFRDVEVWIPNRPGAAPITPRQLAAFEVLHLAGPIRADDRHPWHSGFLLEPPGDPERDPYLRASAVAGLRLSARIAVLSACRPAVGTGAGQGMQAVAAGLASAGVPAVVAALWPGDERATARLMDAFYDALSKGASASAALRTAQQALRGDPATRHPHYWAGFVLIGDGSARAALTPAPAWLWPGLAGAMVVLGAAALALRRRWSHRHEA